MSTSQLASKLASMMDGDDTSPAPDEPLPPTAYAVLGLLSANNEELTPGEIKVRADFIFRSFYWSPAVSHIRRELRRLLDMGMVEEREIAIGQVRRSQVFQTTEKGEQALASWVSESPPEESVIVKNNVLLRVFLGAKAPPEVILSVIDARIEQVEEAIRERNWGLRRAKELGIDQNPATRFPRAVADYELRALHAEQGNLRQLRDTIVGFDVESFKEDQSQRRGPLRQRRSESPDQQ